YIGAAFHVPTYRKGDAYALDVLGEILGGSASARLDRTLQRENQLVLSVGAGYPGISIDPGMFTVYAQPAPGIPVKRVEDALWEQVEKLKKAPPTQAELRRVKRRLAAEYVIRLDSQFYRAMALGRAEIAGSWNWLTKYLPKIVAVTAKDVMRAAQNHLVEGNRTVGILDPLPLKGRRPAAGPRGGGGHIQ
ncbi:MAG: insulinase family protein, partial [Nitrospinota bacterium]|nr:insulinase family protein [Nitrospinota bacterium]